MGIKYCSQSNCGRIKMPEYEKSGAADHHGWMSRNIVVIICGLIIIQYKRLAGDTLKTKQGFELHRPSLHK